MERNLLTAQKVDIKVFPWMMDRFSSVCVKLIQGMRRVPERVRLALR